MVSYLSHSFSTKRQSGSIFSVVFGTLLMWCLLSSFWSRPSHPFLYLRRWELQPELGLIIASTTDPIIPLVSHNQRYTNLLDLLFILWFGEFVQRHRYAPQWAFGDTLAQESHTVAVWSAHYRALDTHVLYARLFLTHHADHIYLDMTLLRWSDHGNTALQHPIIMQLFSKESISSGFQCHKDFYLL